MIGLLLVAEGFEVRVPKGYVYFAMAYSVVVELINIRASKHRRAALAAKEAENAAADSATSAAH